MSDWVEIPIPHGAVQDGAGNVLPYIPITLKIKGTNTNVTHAADDTGASPTTGGLQTRPDGSIGTLTQRRRVQSGQTLVMTATVGGETQTWEIYPASPSVESKVPTDADISGASDRDVLTVKSGLVRVAPAADVLFNSLNFPGAFSSPALNGPALDLAIAACIPATDPATTTRQATRRLHLPPGTYERDDGLPVFAVRSVQGFNLRTGGPQAVKFRQTVDADSIVDINGISRSQFDSFSFDTVNTITVQIGCHIYFDNVALSPTKSFRSTLETKFDFIESSGARVVRGMQIGRDGDNNQVDSLSFGKVHLQGSGRVGFGTISSGSPTMTGVTPTSNFSNGMEIRGYGIPDGTTISSGGGTATLTLSANATQNVTLGSIHAGEAGLWQEGIRIGHAVTANNLLHYFGFMSNIAWRRGVYSAQSGFAISKWQPQNNEVDLFHGGSPNGELRIMSGRSESSLRFVDCLGSSSTPALVTIEDMKVGANQLAADGEWIRHHLPGVFRLNNVMLDGPPAGIVPKIKCSPSRRLNLMAQGLVNEGEESTAFSLSGPVSAEGVWGFIPTTSGAVAVGNHVPDVASAATIALPYSSDVVNITGTTSITAITATGHAKARKTLTLTSTASLVNNGGTLNLNGPFTGPGAITLVCDGTNWTEATPREAAGLQSMLSSDVSTMARHLASTTVTMTSGRAIGGRAVVRAAGTYTKVRVCPGPTITAQTFLQLGVWDSAGTKLAETADCAASAVASTVLEVALVSPIALKEGDVLFIGGASVHTTFTLQGNNFVAAVSALAPQLNRVTTGWVGGALPNLGGTAVANQPWVELVP